MIFHAIIRAGSSGSNPSCNKKRRVPGPSSFNVHVMAQSGGVTGSMSAHRRRGVRSGSYAGIRTSTVPERRIALRSGGAGLCPDGIHDLPPPGSVSASVPTAASVRMWSRSSPRPLGRSRRKRSYGGARSVRGRAGRFPSTSPRSGACRPGWDQRPVPEYGSSAISRAFSIAPASSRASAARRAWRPPRRPPCRARRRLLRSGARSVPRGPRCPAPVRCPRRRGGSRSRSRRPPPGRCGRPAIRSSSRPPWRRASSGRERRTVSAPLGSRRAGRRPGRTCAGSSGPGRCAGSSG